MPVWLQLLSRSRHFGDFPTCGKSRMQIVPEKAQLHARSMSALRQTSLTEFFLMTKRCTTSVACSMFQLSTVFPRSLPVLKIMQKRKIVVVILCKRSSRTCLPNWRALECGSFVERLSGDRGISCYHAYGVDVDATPVISAKTCRMEIVATNCKRKPYARAKRSSFRRMCCGSALLIPSSSRWPPNSSICHQPFFQCYCNAFPFIRSDNSFDSAPATERYIYASMSVRFSKGRGWSYLHRPLWPLKPQDSRRRIFRRILVLSLDTDLAQDLHVPHSDAYD